MNDAAPRTALVVIVRDEVRALLEWVAYHHVIGFDEIVVYDNESHDGTTELCQRLQQAGLITYRYWPDPPPDAEIGPQVPAYEHAVAHSSADWLCFLDADEFLVLESYADVAELIRVAGRQQMPIALNWKIFGSSGEVEYRDELVIKRFTRCAGPDLEENAHIKTFGPVSVLRAGARVHVHGWVLADGQFYVDAIGARLEVADCTFVAPPRWCGAWVNHYIVKSREEFEQKRGRGKATHGLRDPGKYDRTADGYFARYDRNERRDPILICRSRRLHSMATVMRTVDARCDCEVESR